MAKARCPYCDEVQFLINYNGERVCSECAEELNNKASLRAIEEEDSLRYFEEEE